MKTVTVKAKGEIVPGARLILSYRAPRGGRTDFNAMVPSGTGGLDNPEEMIAYAETVRTAAQSGEPVPPPPPSHPFVPPTFAQVIASLATAVNVGASCQGLDGCFKATAVGETLYVQCNDLVDNVKFDIESSDDRMTFDIVERGKAAA